MAAATQQQMPHQPLHHHHSGLQILHGHSIQGMPHGLGLLTTVASLPPKYRSRYLKIQTKCEIPLDLSVKPLSPLPQTPTPQPMTPNSTQNDNEVPMAVNFTEVYTEPCSDTQSQASEDIVEEICSSLADNQEMTSYAPASQQHHNKPITPPLTPNSKRKFSESDLDSELEYKENQQNKIIKVESLSQKQPLVENTPAKQPIKTADTAPKTSKNPAGSTAATSSKSSRSNKATRKLKFDEETSSPVSGTIIRPLEDITDGSVQYSNGDIDPKYNIVEITEETKAELAAIKNVIGDYICRLCRIKFDDAFGLAQHRCACIVLLEYRCPECGKQFNCPANLASHRRWHKPRKPAAAANSGTSSGTLANSGSAAQTKTEPREKKSSKKSEPETGDSISYDCQECGKKFKRQAYLKKHELTHKKQQSPVSQVVAAPIAVINSAHLNYQATASASPQYQTTASPNPPQPSPQHSEPRQIYTANSTHSTEEYNEEDSMSGYSSSGSSTASHHYGRLQIVETGLTEEENIAAAALTNLRNCASVIQHTTLAH